MSLPRLVFAFLATNLAPYPALNCQPYCGTPKGHQSDRLMALLPECVLPQSQQPCSVVHERKRDETREAAAWEEQSKPLVLGPSPGVFILKTIDIETLGYNSH